MIVMTWTMVAVLAAAILTTTVVYNFIFKTILGTTKLLRFQYFMNPLKENSDNDIKIDLLTGKVQAGILQCGIESNFIVFKENLEDGTTKPVAKIWIGIRYVAYGILSNYGQNMESTIPYKPSFESMMKIIELERYIKGEQLGSVLSSQKEVQID